LNEAKFSDIVAQITAVGLIGWGSFLLIKLPTVSRGLTEHAAKMKMERLPTTTPEMRRNLPFDFNGTVDQITSLGIGGIILQALFYISLGVITLIFCAVQRQRRLSRRAP